MVVHHVEMQKIGAGGDDRTHFLAADLPELSTGVDKATITYVFGATGGKLTAVNLVWLLNGNPAPSDRARLIDSGSKIVADFMGGQWQPSVIRGVPAEVCDTCGHGATSAETTERVFEMAEALLEAGAEVGVREYQAA